MSSLVGVNIRRIETDVNVLRSQAEKALQVCKDEEDRWILKRVPHPTIQNTWLVKRIKLKDGR